MHPHGQRGTALKTPVTDPLHLPIHLVQGDFQSGFVVLDRGRSAVHPFRSDLVRGIPGRLVRRHDHLLLPILTIARRMNPAHQGFVVVVAAAVALGGIVHVGQFGSGTQHHGQGRLQIGVEVLSQVATHGLAAVPVKDGRKIVRRDKLVFHVVAPALDAADGNGIGAVQPGVNVRSAFGGKVGRGDHFFFRRSAAPAQPEMEAAPRTNHGSTSRTTRARQISVVPVVLIQASTAFRSYTRRTGLKSPFVGPAIAPRRGRLGWCQRRRCRPERGN